MSTGTWVGGSDDRILDSRDEVVGLGTNNINYVYQYGRSVSPTHEMYSVGHSSFVSQKIYVMIDSDSGTLRREPMNGMSTT